jgi:hypothetical protein
MNNIYNKNSEVMMPESVIFIQNRRLQLLKKGFKLTNVY